MVKVSDMGNYGCYPDCAEKMTTPLFAEANVNLMRRRPMTSLVAHTLGSAITIESILVFSLGVLLLYFTCKCAIVLVHDKSRPAPRDIELSQVQSSSKRTSSTDLYEKLTHFTGWCSSPMFKSQPSNIRQRPFRQSGHGESSKDIHHSSQSSSDHHEGLSA